MISHFRLNLLVADIGNRWQAAQLPAPQPNFVPRIPTTSRNTHTSAFRVAVVNLYVRAVND